MKLRKKLKSQSGLTLIEMVLGMLILSILCMMLGTGFALAQKSYKQVTSNSEMQLLVSTVSDLLYNELRYSSSINTGDNNKLESYTSPSFGENTVISINEENGQLEANNSRMLATGAYDNGTYKIYDLNITYEDAVFTVQFTVKDDINNKIQNTFNVRSINA